MGNIERHKIGLGEVLFSKTQRQVLALLFGHPEKSFYSKEIVNLAGVGIGTVHQELEKLSGCGLLATKFGPNYGNRLHAFRRKLLMSTRKSPKNFELKPEDLEGFDIKDLKCHACSGYGSCGYRMYRLLDGKPVLICQVRKQQLIEERDQQSAKASE